MTAWIKKRIGWKWSLAIVISILICAGVAISGGLDDAAFGVGTSRVNESACMFDDTSPDSVNEGDQGVCRMSANRNQYMTIRDASGQERGVNVTAGNAMEIDIAEQSLGEVQVDLDEILGTSTNVNGGNRDAGTQTVTLADDDPATVSLGVIDNTIKVDDAAFTPATTSVNMAGFEFDDTTPDSVDEGDAGAARMSANRNIYTTIRDAAGNERGVNVTSGGELEIDIASQSLAEVQVDLDEVAGTTTNVNGGNRDAGTQTVTLADDDPAVVSLATLDNAIKVDDAAFTPVTDSVSMIGCEFDDTTPDSVDEGDAGAVRMSANRNMYTTIRDAAGNERGVNVTAGNALEIDVAEQSLTAVKVSATSAANAVNNPMFFQISQDGTNAVDATHPLPISATLAANATGNRIYTHGNIDQLGGNTINVNGGNRDTGTQTVAIADDDNVSTKLTAIDTDTSNIVTAVQLIDNPVFVDDDGFTPATSSVYMVGAEFDDTTPDSVDEGDAGALRMSANRSLYTEIRDGSGNERALDITATGGAEIDIATQTLTAVKVSADANANTATNPIFCQPTDGTAVNAVANPLYAAVSKDNAANATANRIWTTANVDQVGGNAVNTNGGNRDAGTITVAVADDDNVSTKLTGIDSDTNAIMTAVQIMDDWDNGADQANIDIAAVSVTALPISDDASANSETNPIYTEKIAPVLDADDTAACLAIPAAEADYTVTHDQTQICASGNTVYILCANAAPVTADHTVGNFSIVVPDGMCLGPYDFTGLTVCSYIGVAAGGFVCFLGSDYN